MPSVIYGGNTVGTENIDKRYSSFTEGHTPKNQVLISKVDGTVFSPIPTKTSKLNSATMAASGMRACRLVTEQPAEVKKVVLGFQPPKFLKKK